MLRLVAIGLCIDRAAAAAARLDPCGMGAVFDGVTIKSFQQHERCRGMMLHHQRGKGHLFVNMAKPRPMELKARPTLYPTTAPTGKISCAQGTIFRGLVINTPARQHMCKLFAYNPDGLYPTFKPTPKPTPTWLINGEAPPTPLPTHYPTFMTLAPTFSPTAAPVPTYAPTGSSAPTRTPTPMPSAQPTTIGPTATPTATPSAKPTRTPTPIPTLQPTSEPTDVACRALDFCPELRDVASARCCISNDRQLHKMVWCKTIDYLCVQPPKGRPFKHLLDERKELDVELQLVTIYGEDPVNHVSLELADMPISDLSFFLPKLRGRLPGGMRLANMGQLRSLQGLGFLQSIGTSKGGISVDLDGNERLQSAMALKTVKLDSKSLAINANMRLQCVPLAWPDTDQSGRPIRRGACRDKLQVIHVQKKSAKDVALEKEEAAAEAEEKQAEKLPSRDERLWAKKQAKQRAIQRALALKRQKEFALWRKQGYVPTPAPTYTTKKLLAEEFEKQFGTFKHDEAKDAIIGTDADGYEKEVMIDDVDQKDVKESEKELAPELKALKKEADAMEHVSQEDVQERRKIKKLQEGTSDFSYLNHGR